MIRGLRPPFASLVSAGLLCPFLLSCSLSTSCSAPKPAAEVQSKPAQEADKSARKPDKLDRLLKAPTGSFPTAGTAPAVHGAASAPVFGNARPAAGTAKATKPKAITVVGTARNAAMGAVVARADGMAWYIHGMSEWKASLLGKKISVTGHVQTRKLAPDPTVGPDGAVSHGMVGTSSVIVDAMVRPL